MPLKTWSHGGYSQIWDPKLQLGCVQSTCELPMQSVISGPHKFWDTKASIGLSPVPVQNYNPIDREMVTEFTAQEIQIKGGQHTQIISKMCKIPACWRETTHRILGPSECSYKNPSPQERIPPICLTQNTISCTKKTNSVWGFICPKATNILTCT